MKKTGFMLMLLLVACPIASTASALELIAEARFESVQGKPLQEELRFSSLGYEDVVLAVRNGTQDGVDRVSSAVIILNGVKVLKPSDFSQKVASLQRVIVPHDLENVLSVSVRGKPGGYLVVQVMGELSLDLPPDPGPEGDATIEGIDSDQNGVRDDIDRWIGLNYRDSEKTRMALTQAYYPLQNFMIHAREGDSDAVHNDMDDLQRATECLYYVRRDDAHHLLGEMHALVVNTPNRFHADRDASRILGGGTFPSRPYSKWNASCTFNPDEMAD